MYVVSALLFLVVAGLMASVMRMQLAFPNGHVVGPDTFNRLFTMHGTTMVFLVGMPMVAGFSNYLVPLMIGARDMAFPRLNAFGFWIFLFGGLLLYFSYIGGGGLSGSGSAPDVGWFAYAPLTEKAFSRGSSTDYWAIGVLVAGFGSIASAINVIATTFSHALSGNDAQQDADVCVGNAGRFMADYHCAAAAIGRADHVASRPLPGGELL